MSLETNSFEFGEFLLDTKEKVLLRHGNPVSLTPKAFHLLQVLLENHGHLVEKDELMSVVWANSFVEEGNLAFTIRLLRKALGDEKNNPRFIETVPKRGYRFIASLTEKQESPRSAVESTPPTALEPYQKPYFLFAVAVIFLIFIFGVAFVWFSGKNSGSAQPKIARLTTGGRVTIAAVSPDGQNIVFAQKEGIGESLWIRPIEDSPQIQILPPQDGEFTGLTVSPDNKYAYFSFFSENTVAPTLSRVSLSGGVPEPIAGIDSDVSVSFAPDGRTFAFTESFGSLKETHLKTALTDGTNQKSLVKTKGDARMFETYQASPVAWSPDGAAIACAIRESDENSSFFRIILVDPESGSEKYLSEKHWNTIESIIWKDNEHLALIESDPNSEVSGVWEISRKTGEPRQLLNDSNGYQWLSSAGGNLFTLQKSVFSSLHVAEFTENTGALQPKQIFGETGRIDNVGWSRDGKVFYNSWASGKNEIWQISPDGIAPQQLTVNANLINSFAVSPVDDTLVFSALQNGKTVLSAASSDGQKIRRLTDGTADLSPSFTPDGKTVIFQSGTAPAAIWSLDLDGNQAPQQITGYQATHPAISPDGRRIGFNFMDYGSPNPHWKLGLIDRESRKILNKLEFPIPVTQRKLGWRPKSELLTMTFSNGDGSGFLLWSVGDNKFQKIENIGAGMIGAFAWSPDGNRLIYSQNFETSDLVALENF